MHNSRIAISFVSLLLVSVAGSVAHAQTEADCGNFDFTGGLDCRIEIEGGCTAQCTPFNFEAGCTGECTATADTQCEASCGTQCIITCDPNLLDCFAGCHGECDAVVQAQCEASDDTLDCESIAVADCDIHCNASCEVPPSDCSEHCTRCCNGSCTTQVNLDCNLDCFAELTGGCEAQCVEPSGAIFCNGQYVNAANIEQCIAYLVTQGLEVDVSARAEVTCDLDGCTGDFVPSTGCSATGNGGAAGAGLLMMGWLFVATRRRFRRGLRR